MASEPSVRRFPCTNCGAELTFDPASQALRCAHCGQGTPVPQEGSGRIVERDLRDGLAAAPRGLGTQSRVHRCQECGANVAFPSGVTATRCSFCGSSKVLDQSASSQAIRPESLLPFAVTKVKVNAAFGEWIGKLWFRPGDLKRLASVQEVSGVYVPFWTYDADVESAWQAERGRYYYEDEVKTVVEGGVTSQKIERVQKTRWESAWGRRRDRYDDLLVCASKGLPDGLADTLKTFDTTLLRPYASGYLAGWQAEEYGIDLESGWQVAQGRVTSEQEGRCRGDVGGDTQRNLTVDHAFLRVTWKHVLFPIWIAAYRYQGKVYRFLVNGQTGEVVGKAPWSVGKIVAFVLVLAALITALVLLLQRS